MSETYETFLPLTSEDLSSATFSQGLAAGHTLCDWLNGLKTDPAGRARLLASHSVEPDFAEVQRTRDTFGQLFAGSSPSAALQSSLGNRFRQRMEKFGCLEYSLTWSYSDIGQRESLPQLQASGVRKSASACGGWASPRARDPKGKVQGADLNDQAALLDSPLPTGWATPTCQDGKHGALSGGESDRLTKSSFGFGLHAEAFLMTELAGWATAAARDGKDGGTSPEIHQLRRDRMKEKHQNGNGGGIPLGVQAHLTGWPTASARDSKGGYYGGRERDGKLSTDSLDVTAQLLQQSSPQTGTRACGLPAETEKLDGFRPDKDMRLNPAFSLWLMGYPKQWLHAAQRALARKKKKR